MFCPTKALARPAYFVIILALSGFTFSELCLVIKQTKQHVMLESQGLHNKSIAEIEATARLLQRLNSSATNLSRALSSYLNGTELTFATIQTKVAPTLFLVLSTVPQISQASYIGLDGLSFSYFTVKDQMRAAYANISSSPKVYIKPVNRDTGKLYGDATAFEPVIAVNASWYQMALNSTSGFSVLWTGWSKENLFLNIVAMDGRGLIFIGSPVQVIVDHFMALDFHGGDFHLGTAGGEVLMQTKLPDTEIGIDNSTVMVQTMDRNGDPMIHYNLSCKLEDGKSGKMVGKYMFFCSTLDIAGLQTVYVLSYPESRLVSLVKRNSTLSYMLLALVFVFVISSLCIYLYFTAKATNREMLLRASLIKQMEATQQAERKSMNKTKAYAGASHDVRGSLTAVTGLIELCQEEANPGSEMAANLAQMENCTKDLLGILNSILDTSKVEAGKMTLEIEEFNLAKLLEDAVDEYYPLGRKKGIDIILDPCDGSVLRSPLVRGDRIKLKQILGNLINNAIKFTSEGHISVRAVAKKSNFKEEFLASNRRTILKLLSQFCHWKENGLDDLDALKSIEENINEMEFEFEVDDTGKGIPKEKQTSIFEDYVQVKETAVGEEGCGLGLGIVQSLVRVMKGELRIVEKEPGERGTCFKFNVFLSTTEPEFAQVEEHRPSNARHQHFGFMSPKPEGSHLVFFIEGEERRKVLKKYIEGLNINLTMIKQGSHFPAELEKIKRKLDLSCSGSTKNDLSLLDYLSKSSSTNSDIGPSEAPLSIKDSGDHSVPYHRNNSRSSSGFILLVIDKNAASYYSYFDHLLAEFRKDIPKSSCKVVWLYDQASRDSRHEAQGSFPAEGDYVIHKPLHGSHLLGVLSLLPERKGLFRCNFSMSRKGLTVQGLQHSGDPNPPHDSDVFSIELDNASSTSGSIKEIAVDISDGHVKRDVKPVDKALTGKKILLVEDIELLRKLISASLQRLGAIVELCTNGKEALNQVCKALSDQKLEGDSQSLPYDYVFMDCEMPVMNGYEATRLIRMEEQHHGVHIPIIALSAHAMPEEASKSVDAGMDYHLTKPLQVNKLLEVMEAIDS